VKTAYSYVRWSDVTQGKGDSERRQVQLRDAWLSSRPDVALDTTLKLTDRGVSGYRGTHRSDKHCLGQFVAQVEAGRVPLGSYLLVENLDRLSREETQEALELVLKLTRLGVVVVQLSPVVCEFVYPVEPMKLMMSIMELSRGNSESKIKSERITKSWQRAREDAAATGKVVGRAVPSWFRVADEKIVLIPERAELVRTVHKLAQDGMGASLIAQKLNTEKVPVWGRSKHWHDSAVYAMLTDLSMIGTWQPGTGGRAGNPRKSVGEPIKGYFPRVVSDDCYYATQAAIKSRHGFRGAKGKHVNLFAGLLNDALGRRKCSYTHRSDGISRIFNRDGRMGIVAAMTYPADVFERQVLAVLREIDDKVIAGDDASGISALANEGRLAEVDAQLTAIEEQLMAGGGAALLGKVAARLETERAGLLDSIEKDRRKAAVPSGQSWGVLKAEADLGDEAVRLRLRSAIRQVVSAVWVVFASDRVGRYTAWVEVILTNGAFRVAFLSCDRRMGKPPTDKSHGDCLSHEEWHDPKPKLADDVWGASDAENWRDIQIAGFGPGDKAAVVAQDYLVILEGGYAGSV